MEPLNDRVTNILPRGCELAPGKSQRIFLNPDKHRINGEPKFVCQTQSL